MAALGLTLFGCAHQSTLDVARRALAEGRYEAVGPDLAKLSESRSPEADEARRLLAEIEEARRATALVLLEKARKLENGLGPDRSQARAYLELVLTLLRGTGPEAEAAAREVADITAWVHERERTWVRLAAVLDAHAGECTPEEQADTLNKLRTLRRELGRRYSLMAKALTAANACFQHGRELDGLTLSELAVELRLPSETLPAAATLRMAAAYAHLPPTSPAEQRGEPEPAPRPVKPAPRVASVVAPPPETTLVDAVLGRAQALYAEGKVFEALLMLDEAVSTYDPTGGARLRAQRDSWKRDRLTLVGDYLTRAERALQGQDPDTAYSWYARVLALDPGHDVALDRVRKIEAFRRLRSGQRS
jgi:hypothetical protein